MFKSNIFANRPTRAEIYLRNLDNNISVIRDIVGDRKILGVVKANAYGHGLVEISKRLEKLKIDYLGVAYIEEALWLRKNKIKLPILVLGAVENNQIHLYIKNNIDITGSSIEKLESISKTAKRLKKKARVHLKFDTGMGRIGVQWDRKEDFLKKAFSLDNLEIVGIFSHFADSYDNPEFTNLQLKRFTEILDFVKDKYHLPPLIHLANSGALSRNLASSFFTMVRPGIMMYGYSLDEKVQRRLKPLMIFKTKVLYFKVLEKGQSVGYARTYLTKKRERIVTLPVGYADGYPRSLSNSGVVNINSKKFPIVGRVCMDQCMVSLGDKGEAYVGDDVELWGEKIKLQNISKQSERSMWDLLSNITERVPRKYLK